MCIRDRHRADRGIDLDDLHRQRLRPGTDLGRGDSGGGDLRHPRHGGDLARHIGRDRREPRDGDIDGEAPVDGREGCLLYTSRCV